MPAKKTAPSKPTPSEAAPETPPVEAAKPARTLSYGLANPKLGGAKGGRGGKSD